MGRFAECGRPIFCSRRAGRPRTLRASFSWNFMFAYLVRVLLFFVAISVIRSVVQGVVRAYRGGNPSPGPGSQRSGSGNAATSPGGSTLLHQDPVCGTYVAAGSSLRKIVRGKVYHFCSETCRDRFSAPL